VRETPDWKSRRAIFRSGHSRRASLARTWQQATFAPSTLCGRHRAREPEKCRR
jgi:hypothetical protein